MTDGTANTPPLGRHEDERLEFKGRDALERPERIAREVVAMLNAVGGDVWIGLGEEDGVARRLEPVSNAESQQDRLYDCFVERIEPRPNLEEISVAIVSVGSDRILNVRVESGTRGPYALLHRGARAFLRRVGRRIVEMSREELNAAFDSGPSPATPSRILEVKQSVIAGGQSLIWIGASISPPLALDLHGADEDLRELLRDSTRSGNRVSGWTVMSRYTESGHDSDRIWEELAAPDTKYAGWELSLEQDGFLQWRAQLAMLEHDDAETIYPYAILEYPASFLRLAAHIMKREDPGGRALSFDILMQGVDGWRLWPFSPGRGGWKEEFFAQPPIERELLTLPRPLDFDGTALVENPDACAWQAVRTLYLELGYTEDDIPREFNRTTKRLEFNS